VCIFQRHLNPVVIKLLPVKEATMTDSASDGIRFEDGIQPANSREKQLPFTESSSTSDNTAADIDDLQKKFADQDLNHKKKQVSKLPSTSSMSLWTTSYRFPLFGLSSSWR
jgi:hypothetical protein